MTRDKNWKVVTRAQGGDFVVWIDLPNGYAATTYSPCKTKAEATRVARNYREGMKMVQTGKRRAR